MNPLFKILPLMLLCLAVASCREDEMVIPAEYSPVPETPSDGSAGVVGFYLLNEGNMGSNKATIDYFDYTTGLYARNFYAERNPTVVKELGDVGNDIAIYGSKLYAVINCSHKVEVMDAASGVRIGQVDIPNCRSLAFHGGRAYVTSYVGPVQVDPSSPKGAVFEVDTTTLQITRKVTVGYQPEQMAILDGYMYVANSGGYRIPEYDNTLSVINLDNFRQIRQIPVAINLRGVKADRYGRLWVSSGGDRMYRQPRLFLLQPNGSAGGMEILREYPTGCSDMALDDNYLYFISSAWSDLTMSNRISYGKIDLQTLETVTDQFITDDTDRSIKIPYGIAIHPTTGDIFVTDARNYVSSGTLYCFTPAGTCKWSVRTGDIPAHIAFRLAPTE